MEGRGETEREREGREGKGEERQRGSEERTRKRQGREGEKERRDEGSGMTVVERREGGEKEGKGREK